MDYIEVKNWLASYRTLYYEVQEIDNKMKGVKAIAYTDEAPGGLRASIDYYLSKKEEYEKQMSEIEKTIYSIPNYQQRMALIHRYIEFMKVKEIAKVMHYNRNYMSEIIIEGIKTCEYLTNSVL